MRATQAGETRILRINKMEIEKTKKSKSQRNLTLLTMNFQTWWMITKSKQIMDKLVILQSNNSLRKFKKLIHKALIA